MSRLILIFLVAVAAVLSVANSRAIEGNVQLRKLPLIKVNLSKVDQFPMTLTRRTTIPARRQVMSPYDVAVAMEKYKRKLRTLIYLKTLRQRQETLQQQRMKRCIELLNEQICKNQGSFYQWGKIMAQKIMTGQIEGIPLN